MTYIDFPIDTYGDLLVADDRADRILRVFAEGDGVTVVDARPTKKLDENTVWLVICDGKPLESGGLSIFPQDEVVSQLLDDVAQFHHDADTWFYPDSTRVIRVDFCLETGAIETARDVTEDLGVVTEEQADEMAEANREWADHCRYESSAHHFI